MIEAVGKIDPELEEELIHERFDEILSAGEGAEGRLTRWLLSALTHKADRHAPYRLATKPGTMNVDPAATAKFFMRFFKSPEFRDERVTSALCEVLTTSPSERTEALHLHIMRAMTLRSLGDPEGRVFERPALDTDRPSPTRCWAWQAYATTPRWSIKGAMDFIESEADPLVRRAALMTLKHRLSGRRAVQFLDHIEGRFPVSKFTTAYLRRAA